MKTSADPVRAYLSAVERETSTLPADRRQELLADLAEHIEVSRAERPDAPVGEVLAGLGDPRTIAATALAEAGDGAAWAPAAPAPGPVGAPARRGRVHPLVPLVMLALALPFAVVFTNDNGGSLVGGLLRITGAVLLCTSVHWTAVQKITGVLVSAVLPIVAVGFWNLAAGSTGSGEPDLLANLLLSVLLVGPSVWLWRVRRV
ncbi:HAAS signaling domain-containing protein [Streptomyces sp. NPDC059247]|uniref:HAAS signaling domain-containing protein n=1 Tax=Streptomyces sp. NPDC059247 TaxID=3346790 RepID=UPI003676D49E